MRRMPWVDKPLDELTPDERAARLAALQEHIREHLGPAPMNGVKLGLVALDRTLEDLFPKGTIGEFKEAAKRHNDAHGHASDWEDPDYDVAAAYERELESATIPANQYQGEAP